MKNLEDIEKISEWNGVEFLFEGKNECRNIH